MSAATTTPVLLTMTQEQFDLLVDYREWPDGYANQLFDEIRALSAALQQAREELDLQRAELEALKQ